MGQIYDALRKMAEAKKTDGLKEQAEYIESKLPKDVKKGS